MKNAQQVVWYGLAIFYELKEAESKNILYGWIVEISSTGKFI